MVLADVQIRAEKFGAPGWLIGAALSSMFVVQVLVSPLWGSAADRYGRKPVVIICTLISAASMLAFALSSSIGWIFASRILAGLAAANVAVAQAWIAAGSTEEDRTANMGRLGAAISGGLILGPAIGGYLAHTGGNFAVGIVGMACSLVGALAVTFATDIPVAADADKEGKAPLRALFAQRRLLALMVLACISWFALACLEGTFARLLQHRWNRDQLWFGLIFGFESAISLVVQAWLLGQISKKWSDRRLVTVGLIMQGIGLASMPYFPIFGFVFLGSSLYALGNALFGPSLNAWFAKLTPDPLKGTMFGGLQAARSFGFMVGPIVGGALFDYNNGLPYLLAGVVCLVASAVAARLPR